MERELEAQAERVAKEKQAALDRILADLALLSGDTETSLSSLSLSPSSLDKTMTGREVISLVTSLIRLNNNRAKHLDALAAFTPQHLEDVLSLIDRVK
ncbi:hypothetical protein KIPB_007551, partial [Kipferlia bialata]|eukprot:g7551.t1